MPPASFVIVDEAHHYAAAEWSVAPREYLKSGALLMGLTATPERADGIGLGVEVGGLFDGLVVVAQVRDLIALNATNDRQGVTPIEIVFPKEVTRLAKAPVEAYLLYAKDRYCVVFAPNVKNAEKFAADFAASGIEALVVHGGLKKDVRDDRLARFAGGDVKVLVNVAVLTEGWDAPICDSLIVARPVGSFSLLRQMIGRARRARPGKKSALYIDLANNVEMHGHPDSDIEYDLRDGMSSGGRRALPGERKCRVCGKFLGDAIADAKARGLELTYCPECKTKLSKIELLTPDEIALQKAKDIASIQKTPTDQRVKALATMYEAEIRKGVKGKRSTAEHAYRNIFKSGFPPTEVRVAAWRLAKERTNAA
jgi:superfamily II DNA or RNA helicase